jgi:hypothetical protein
MRILDENGLRCLWQDFKARLGTVIPKSEKGKAGGVATLDSNGKVPESQLLLDAFARKAELNTPDPDGQISTYPHSTLAELARQEGAGIYTLPQLGTFTDRPVDVASIENLGQLTVTDAGEGWGLLLRETGTLLSWLSSIPKEGTNAPPWSVMHLGNRDPLTNYALHPEASGASVFLASYDRDAGQLTLYIRDIQFQTKEQFDYNERLFEIDNSKYHLMESGVMISHHLPAMIGRGPDWWDFPFIVIGRATGTYGDLVGKPVLYGAIRHPFNKLVDSRYWQAQPESSSISVYMDAILPVFG